MIVGLVPQDGGSVTVDDIDITSLPMHERARNGIGYLPQEASIFRRLTVEQNLMGVLEVRGDLTREERTDKMESLLEEFQYHISDSHNERKQTHSYAKHIAYLKCNH
jgi:lipopolysaccharide export system ATP-binding protein